MAVAMKEKISFYLIPLCFILSLTPLVNSVEALGLGIFIAIVLGNVHAPQTRKLTRPMLSAAIIALGAGMNLFAVARAGLSGIAMTFVGLSVTIFVGFILGRLLKVSSGISLLINTGTAICGGSAIAAVSSAIHAKEEDTSVALGVVFVLNACALVVFPLLGHVFHLNQHQFGVWSAMAIHDTSSVVGATIQYGRESLEIGTTIKLARALWIVPVTLVVSYIHSRRSPQSEVKVKRQYPWFILGFLATSAIITFVPALHDIGGAVEYVGRHLFVGTLFLIGLGLSLKTLKEVGLRPLLQGVLLWFFVASANLAIILF
jgi:uncharacterized integral membrane protein (TIGR00698 family)